MKARGILILERREIASLLSLKRCLEVVETAFRLHGEGRTLASGLLHVDADGGEFHIKAGGLKLDRTYFALKANGGFFRNRERFGLPNIQGVIILFDGGTGSPLSLMDSIEITILRTGAAVAVAARHLARPDSSTVTVCGCGNQGRIQLKALAQVLPRLSTVFAFDEKPESADAYASQMTRELGIPVTSASSLEDAARRSDVVVTCTPSRKPFLLKKHIRPGTFIAAVGADSPEKQELEPALLAGNKVVADILEQCVRVGESHHAIDSGLIRERDIHGELGAVVAGKTPGRTSDSEITIFDATGAALQDAAAAVAVYKEAVKRGAGVLLDLQSGMAG